MNWLSRLWRPRDPWLRAYARLPEPKTLEDIHLDEPALRAALEASPAPVRPWRSSAAALREWIQKAAYREKHPQYYPENLAEKAFEHLVAAELLQLRAGEVYLDVASQNGVAAEIYGRLFGVETFLQDLSFPPGLHGRRAGGDAGAIPLPDSSVDALALHCSFEHFEGESDRRFIREAARLLRPGGRGVIVPLYLCQEYCILTDPLAVAAGGGAPPREPGARLHASRTFGNRHGRFYSPARLIERVWNERGPLEMEIVAIENFREVDPSIYARYALLLRRPPS